MQPQQPESGSNVQSSGFYVQTSFNGDDSLTEMQAQKLKLLKMKYLYNQTESLVESLSMSTGDKKDNPNRQQSYVSNEDLPMMEQTDQSAQVGYYQPLRVSNLFDSQMSAAHAHRAATQQDEEFLVAERQSALSINSNNIKNAMRTQNSQLGKILSGAKPPSSRHPHLSNSKLLNASMVKKSKIETPHQYMAAYRTFNSSGLKRKTNSTKNERNSRKSSSRPIFGNLCKLKGRSSSVISAKPTFMSVALKKNKIHSNSKYQSSDDKAGRLQKTKVFSLTSQRTPAQMRKLFKAPGSKSKSSKSKKSAPKHFQSFEPINQQQSFLNHLTSPNLQGQQKANDYSMYQSADQGRIINLNNVNPRYNTSKIESERNENFQMQNQEQSRDSKAIRMEDQRPEMASAEFDFQLQQLNNSGQDSGQFFNSAHNFSGFVNTTNTDSGRQDHHLMFNRTRQTELHSNEGVIEIQNNTFGNEDVVQNLADTYNFELHDNSQNIFDHRQKLSNITSDCQLTTKVDHNLNNHYTTQQSSLPNFSMSKNIHDLTDKQSLSMLSNNVSNRTAKRSTVSKRGSSLRNNKSSLSSRNQILTKRCKDSKERDSQRSNSVSKSIRSFIGIKNRGSSVHQTLKPAKNVVKRNAGQKMNHTHNLKPLAENLVNNNNSMSYASMATQKTLDSKYRNASYNPKGAKTSINNQESLKMSKDQKLKQLAMLQNLQTADRYYFDLTIRKYFCVWIERFIAQIKMKKTLMTIPQESEYDTALQGTSKSKSRSRSKSRTKSGNNKTTSLTKSQKKKSNSSHHSPHSNKKLKGKCISQTYVLLPPDQSKSSLQMAGNHLHLVQSPVTSMQNMSFKYKEGNLVSGREGIESDKLMIVNSSQQSLQNTLNGQRTALKLKEDEQFGTVSQQESIFNIESKNNISYENYFAPQNAFQSSKITRNISTISENNDHREFRQTAQLGGEGNTEMFEINKHKSQQSAIVDMQAKLRIDKGLKIISKFNSKKIKFIEKEKQTIHPKHNRQKSSQSLSKSRSRSRSHVKTKSLSNYSKSASEISKKSRGRSSNHTPINLGISNLSQTLATYRKHSPTISSIDQQRTITTYLQDQSQARKSHTNSTNRGKKQRPKSHEYISILKKESRSSSPSKKSKSVSQNKITIIENSDQGISKRTKKQLSKVQHFFLTWHSKSMKQKEEERANGYQFSPMQIYRTNMKWKAMQSFRKLKQMRAQVSISANQVYSFTASKLVNKSFLAWITIFNELQKERRNTYTSSKHWMLSHQRKYLDKWSANIQERKLFRHKIRKVGPMRCLITMLSQQSHIPRDMELKHVGQELFECTKYYQVQRMERATLVQSFRQYQLNLTQEMFNVFKLQYHKVSTFKANQAIKIAFHCIQGWRAYSAKRAERRQKLEALNQRKAVQQFKNILVHWCFYSKYKSNFRQRQILFRKHILHNLKVGLFVAVREHALKKSEKSFLSYKARTALEQKLRLQYLANLIAYQNYRKQKCMRSDKIRAAYRSKHLQQVFTQLKTVSKVLYHYDLKSDQIQQKSNASLKAYMLKEWTISFKISVQANKHYEFNVKVFWMRKLREAAVLSQIRKEKNIQAEHFRTLSVKQGLLHFLQEFAFEQLSKRERRAYLLGKGFQNYKKLIFRALAKRVVTKFKNRDLKVSLKENYDQALKYKVIKGLQMKSALGFEARKMEQFKILKFKQEMFDCLRYAVNKQTILRNALITTIEKRNIKRANLFMKEWRITTFRKINKNQDIETKMIIFKARRVIKKFERVIEYSKRKREISWIMETFNSMRVQKKSFQALHAFSKSRIVQLQKQARQYRRKQLLAPAFVSMKATFCLRKICKILQEITRKRVKKTLMDRWIGKKKERIQIRKSDSGRIIILRKKTFKALLQFKQESIHERLNETLVEAYSHENLLSKFFSQLKWFTQNKQGILDNKINLRKMNNVRYLKAKFGAWASITRKIKARNVLMVRVKVPRTKKIEQNCFSKWKADFEMENKAKKAGIHKEIYVKKAFFNFTKKEVSRNKLLIKLFESARRDHNYMRMILEQVKINANERKEARELKKWGRSGSQNRELAKKTKAIKPEEAILSRVKILVQNAFGVLKERRQRNLRLRECSRLCRSKVEQNQKKKVVENMMETYVIQPRLDAIADHHLLKRSLQKFVYKVNYIMDRQTGQNLHEFEVRAYTILGQKLMRKAFSVLKTRVTCNQLKAMEYRMIEEYQFRKWFYKWRTIYLLRIQNNYLLPPIDHDNYRERHRSKSKSKERQAIRPYSSQKALDKITVGEGIVNGDTFYKEPVYIQQNDYQQSLDSTQKFRAELKVNEFQSFKNQQSSANKQMIRTEQQSLESLNNYRQDSSIGNSVSMKQRVQELGQKINQRLGRSRSNESENFEASEVSGSRAKEIITLIDQRGKENQMDASNTQSPRNVFLNDTMMNNNSPQRSSPGKQPKQGRSPQKSSQKKQRTYLDEEDSRDFSTKLMQVMDQNNTNQSSEQKNWPKVPPLHDLSQRLKTGGRSFKAFLTKNKDTTSPSARSPMFSGSKQTSGNKSGALSNQSLDDEEGSLPVHIYN